MMSDMTRLIDRYVQFEQRVRRWTDRWCRPFCSTCDAVCCRSDFCLETRQSAFLARVVRQTAPESVFDTTRGWLGATGCSLVAGRPPVCYEFLCSDICNAVAGDSDRRHALLAASMVLSHAGKRVLGGRHLVEATRSADLNRINEKRFMTRLVEAEAAFQAAAYILGGRPSTAGIRALTRIVPPPRTAGRRQGG
jgi:hypothetical protein